MTVELNYFGTDLQQHGHFFFSVYAESLGRSNIRLEKLPFNPESLPYKLTHTTGRRENYHAFGFTILAISGSVVDKRPASKSIFFVEKEIPFDEMEQLVRSTKFGSKVMEILLKSS